MLMQVNPVEPLICVGSLHPLAAHSLKEAIEADTFLRCRARIVTNWCDLLPRENGEVLLLDGFCDDSWPKIALRWQKAAGAVLVLLPPSSARPAQQLRALFLGVRGVIVTSGVWQKEVCQAIRAVMEGGFWITREVMNEYIRRTTALSKSHLGDTDPLFCLTAREEQIMCLLLRGDSNKDIGNCLGITERTVKYHVSNILQKSQVSSRRALRETMSNEVGFARN
jgi:DNA-binding NarL/FixJ family response regulator